jgi:hypothetical protein
MTLRYWEGKTRALMPLVGFLCLFLWIVVPVATAEELTFALGSDWKTASAHEEHRQLMIEFVRKADDINNWRELFTYQNFAKGKQTPEEFLNKLKAAREKECPAATVWNVIEQNESSILYEWRAKPCLGWPEQHEVARIILGKNNLFVLHYVAKVNELAPDTRTKWIKILQEATIDSGTKSGESSDVDNVVPFEMDKVMAALKPAMESPDCNVKEATANRVECKRPRNTTGDNGCGGESVTAVLEAQGDKTRVQIKTGKGFYGLLCKKDWSMPIYQSMIKNMEKAQ